MKRRQPLAAPRGQGLHAAYLNRKHLLHTYFEQVCFNQVGRCVAIAASGALRYAWTIDAIFMPGASCMCERRNEFPG